MNENLLLCVGNVVKKLPDDNYLVNSSGSIYKTRVRGKLRRCEIELNDLVLIHFWDSKKVRSDFLHNFTRPLLLSK